MTVALRWEQEREVFTFPDGTEYVRATGMDPVDFEYQPRARGLPILQLTKRENSVSLRAAATRARRHQRRLKARGLV